ncbi:hypothetical protein CYMTET_8686 [Cymbomonas tetramitiformis]|uniref:Uncharacterized protein n=1 Tax=Cymbomonas tetramitiformis TaxID=36881 RepID=A0AAE0GT75_9CHLO|nr:hypothetical protein CYMTET_8686 [Cymbomonas tetramitiformis]
MGPGVELAWSSQLISGLLFLFREKYVNGHHRAMRAMESLAQEVRDEGVADVAIDDMRVGCMAEPTQEEDDAAGLVWDIWGLGAGVRERRILG